jgi:hypothetical protein
LHPQSISLIFCILTTSMTTSFESSEHVAILLLSGAHASAVISSLCSAKSRDFLSAFQLSHSKPYRHPGTSTELAYRKL